MNHIGMPLPENSAVTLTFDLFISQCIQLILVPICTQIVNLAEFPQTVSKICLPF